MKDLLELVRALGALPLGSLALLLGLAAVALGAFVTYAMLRVTRSDRK